MKISIFIFLTFLYLVGTDAQRTRASTSVEADNPTQPRKARGKVRFSLPIDVDAELADIPSKAIRPEPNVEPRTESKPTPIVRKVKTSTRKAAPYEVQEVIDDVPDKNVRKVHKSRVITETRFEAANAPKKSSFEPFPRPEDEITSEELFAGFTPQITKSTTEKPKESTEKKKKESAVESTDSQEVKKLKNNLKEETITEEKISVNEETITISKEVDEDLPSSQLPEITTSSEVSSTENEIKKETKPPISNDGKTVRVSRTRPQTPSPTTSEETPSRVKSRGRVRPAQTTSEETSQFQRSKPRSRATSSDSSEVPSRGRTTSIESSRSRTTSSEASETPPRVATRVRTSRRRIESNEETPSIPSRSRGPPVLGESNPEGPVRSRTGRKVTYPVADSEALQSENKVFTVRPRRAQNSVKPEEIQKSRGRPSRGQQKSVEVTEAPKTNSRRNTSRRKIEPLKVTEESVTSSSTSTTTTTSSTTTERNLRRNNQKSQRNLSSTSSTTIPPRNSRGRPSKKVTLNPPVETFPSERKLALKSRQRSRFVQPIIDEQKLEVLPLFESEAKTVEPIVRKDSFSVARGNDDKSKSTNEIISVVKPKSKENIEGDPQKPVVKATVETKISEVVSTRRVVRPIVRKRKKSKDDKANTDSKKTASRGQKKAELTKTLNSSDEGVDESDNYPAPFKALLHAKAKEDKQSSRTTFAEEPSTKKAASNEKVVTRVVSTPSSTSAPRQEISRSTSKVNEDDNNILPSSTVSTTRGTRRKFSLATKPPDFEENQPTAIPSRRPSSTGRRPKPARPTVLPLSQVSVVTEISQSVHAKHRYHARFVASSTTEETPNSPQENQTHSSTTPRAKFSAKTPRGLYSSRKSSGKKKERNGANQQQLPSIGKKKKNRYSARYRSDIVSRATNAPAYTPTVPTVTPSYVKQRMEDGMEIISIDEPVNTIPSDNLINGELLTPSNTPANLLPASLVTSSEPTVRPAEKQPVSIIERIIYSITAISSTVAPNKTLDETVDGPTKETAIFKIPSKKEQTKQTTDQTNEILTATTEKPTTIIERILSSINAIQSTSSPTVGISTVSSTARTPSSTITNTLGVIEDLSDEQTDQQRTISKLLAILKSISPTPGTELVVVTPKNTFSSTQSPPSNVSTSSTISSISSSLSAVSPTSSINPNVEIINISGNSIENDNIEASTVPIVQPTPESSESTTETSTVSIVSNTIDSSSVDSSTINYVPLSTPIANLLKFTETISISDFLATLRNLNAMSPTTVVSLKEGITKRPEAPQIDDLAENLISRPIDSTTEVVQQNSPTTEVGVSTTAPESSEKQSTTITEQSGILDSVTIEKVTESSAEQIQNTTEIAIQSLIEIADQSSTGTIDQSTTEAITQNPTEETSQNANIQLVPNSTEEQSLSSTESVDISPTEEISKTLTEQVNISSIKETSQSLTKQNLSEQVESRSSGQVSQSSNGQVFQSSTEVVDFSSTETVSQSSTEQFSQSLTAQVESRFSEEVSDQTSQSSTEQIPQSLTEKVVTENTSQSLTEQSSLIAQVSESSTEQISQSTTEQEAQLASSSTEQLSESSTEPVSPNLTEQVTPNLTEEISPNLTEKNSPSLTEKDQFSQQVELNSNNQLDLSMSKQTSQGSTVEISQNLTEQVESRSFEQVSESSTDQMSQSLNEQGSQSPTEQISEVSTEPISQGSTDQSSQGSTEKVSQSLMEQVTPTEQSSTEKPTPSLTEQVAPMLAEQISQSSTEKLAPSSTEQVTQSSTEQIVSGSTEQSALSTTEEGTQNVSEEIVQSSTTEIEQTGTEKSAQISSAQVTQSSVEEITGKSSSGQDTQNPTEQTVQSPTEQADISTTEQTVNGTIEQVVQGSTEGMAEILPVQVIESQAGEIAQISSTEQADQNLTEEAVKNLTEQVVQDATEGVVQNEQVTQTATENGVQNSTDQVGQNSTQGSIENSVSSSQAPESISQTSQAAPKALTEQGVETEAAQNSLPTDNKTQQLTDSTIPKELRSPSGILALITRLLELTGTTPNTISSTITLEKTTVRPANSNLSSFSNFEVSPGSVTVFSANDVTSTFNQSDDGTTVTISSRTFAASKANRIVNNTTNSSAEIVTNATSSLSEISPSDNVTNTNNTMDRQGKLLSNDPRPIEDNAIETSTAPAKDYYIFAILPNNTIIRKRPSMYPNKNTPFIVVGVYPNNTVVQKFPNGTLIPEEPVVQVSGFDTSPNPQTPRPEITSNQLTQDSTRSDDNNQTLQTATNQDLPSTPTPTEATNNQVLTGNEMPNKTQGEFDDIPKSNVGENGTNGNGMVNGRDTEEVNIEENTISNNGNKKPEKIIQANVEIATEKRDGTTMLMQQQNEATTTRVTAKQMNVVTTIAPVRTTIPTVITTIPTVRTTPPPIRTTLPPITTTIPPMVTTLPPVKTTIPSVMTTMPPVMTTIPVGTTLPPVREKNVLQTATPELNLIENDVKETTTQRRVATTTRFTNTPTTITPIFEDYQLNIRSTTPYFIQRILGNVAVVGSRVGETTTFVEGNTEMTTQRLQRQRITTLGSVTTTKPPTARTTTITPTTTILARTMPPTTVPLTTMPPTTIPPTTIPPTTIPQTTIPPTTTPPKTMPPTISRRFTTTTRTPETTFWTTTRKVRTATPTTTERITTTPRRTARPTIRIVTESPTTTIKQPTTTIRRRGGRMRNTTPPEFLERTITVTPSTQTTELPQTERSTLPTTPITFLRQSASPNTIPTETVRYEQQTFFPIFSTPREEQTTQFVTARPITKTPRTTPPTTLSAMDELRKLAELRVSENFGELSTTNDFVSTTAPSPTTLQTTLKSVNDKVKQLTEQQKKDLQELARLEKEQAEILKQLTFLTRLNFGGPVQKPTRSPSNLASRVLEFAADRDKKTTTESPLDLLINPVDSTKVPPGTKDVSLEDLLRQFNVNPENVTPSNLVSTYGESTDAILAALLKEQGIGPSTPRTLGEQLKTTIPVEIPTERTTQKVITTTRRKVTTTTPRPGPIMQGLNWLLNMLAAPPTTKRPTKKRLTTTERLSPITDDIDIFSSQPTEINPVVVAAPKRSTSKPNVRGGRKYKRPLHALSENELSSLITQLEEAQKDPKKAENLDLSAYDLGQTTQKTTTLVNDNAVQITNSGKVGSTLKLQTASTVDKEVVYKRKSTTPIPSTISNSVSEDEEDPEPPKRPTLRPVVLNPVPGIDDEEGETRVRGQLLSAAVNVTRAISQFLGSAIQRAGQSFQSLIGAGSRQVGTLLASSSSANG